jgi:hypothetical protein
MTVNSYNVHNFEILKMAADMNLISFLSLLCPMVAVTISNEFEFLYCTSCYSLARESLLKGKAQYA